jgi:hypothetical protein
MPVSYPNPLPPCSHFLINPLTSRYKAWKLLSLHPVCTLVFTLGYALRAYGSYNYIYTRGDTLVLINFILSQVFTYICP